MKILLVNSTLGGGAGIACKRLLNALLKSKSDAKLLTLETHGKRNIFSYSKGFIFKFLKICNFIFERLRFVIVEKSKRVRFAFSIANWGFDVSNHQLVKEASIIHLHWVNNGFISLNGLDNLFSKGKPIVWTLHDMWPFTGGCHYSGDCANFLNSCGNCWMIKRSYPEDLSHTVWSKKHDIFKGREGAITFIACSRWMLSQAKKSSLLNKFKVVYLPNAIDIDLFKPLDRKCVRMALNLPKDKILVLFGAANILDYRKGFNILIDSLKELQTTVPNAIDKVEFVVFGKNKSDIVSHFQPFKIHQLGSISEVDDMVNVYNSCDCFITPSIEDNLPNTVMEALACGTPVIGLNVGGIPEMVEHKVSGYISEEISAVGLAKGLGWALSSEFDFETLTLNSRNVVVNNYSEEMVAKKHLELYNQVLSEEN